MNKAGCLRFLTDLLLPGAVLLEKFKEVKVAKLEDARVQVFKTLMTARGRYLSCVCGPSVKNPEQCT